MYSTLVKLFSFRCLLLFFLIGHSGNLLAEIRDFAEFTEKLTQKAGFRNILTNGITGSVYLELPVRPSNADGTGSQEDNRFIFQTSLARGIGSNDIGLDRGQLGETRLVSFERFGEKALLVAHNTRYRALAQNPAEKQAVTEAFAKSVIWGFKVVASDENRYLIDYTDFLLSDIYHVSEKLKQRNQGSFKVDASRSAPYHPMIKGFPDNIELEGLITLTGKDVGRELNTVSPDAHAVTVHIHHSLIRLPKPGFTPRAFHPSSGYGAFIYDDYSAPIDEDMTQRIIRRHRLKSGEKLTYYFDPGVPEPVRSALMEGASWWNQAFEAAGFDQGFEVKLLPKHADPMDVRYNIVQWVHRSTRGWSYGASIVDPRNGEILKGKITLGSLRIRQDLLIAQGLLSPFKSTLSNAEATSEIKAMALARIRQLAAHEIGHTLGLAHNYAASTTNRASVMDYPHPLLALDQGEENSHSIDLSNAYATGIGTWDKHAITYGYKIVPSDSEQSFLARHIADGKDRGLSFISDRDARATGGAHPNAHLWDSGENIITELEKTLRIRKVALNRMGQDSLPVGAPFSELADILVPIYYLHRYQAEAVVKLIGGVNYDYTLKGVTQYAGISPVSSDQQNSALTVMLLTLDPSTLTPPASLVKLIAPKPLGYRLDRENAPGLTAPVFDPVTAAEAVAEETLKLLFNPQRLARLEQQHAINKNIAGVEDVIQSLLSATVFSKQRNGLEAEIQKRINLLVVENLLIIATAPTHAPEVNAIALQAIKGLAGPLAKSKTASRQYLAHLIDQTLKNGQFTRRQTVANLPPGSPI